MVDGRQSVEQIHKEIVARVAELRDLNRIEKQPKVKRRIIKKPHIRKRSK